MIRHIVALDNTRGIARQGSEPWNLPTDLTYFSEQSKSHGGIVLMGRKTYDSIGRPLPDRQNFVLTRQGDFRAPGVETVHDLQSFLRQHKDVWVIGGAELFALTLAEADELYITEIEQDFGCDVFYPEYQTSFERSQASERLVENGVAYRFAIYKPRRT